ncbi:MAG: hypothetical protein RMK20_00455 [Verrucomicrobiales bacterium]|nr:hypothetical protein [Verrucomicrobiales bacterium]
MFYGAFTLTLALSLKGEGITETATGNAMLVTRARPRSKFEVQSSKFQSFECRRGFRIADW